MTEEGAKGAEPTTWLVAGSDDLVTALEEAASAAGIVVTRVDAAGAAAALPGTVVVVELPGDGAEGILQSASKAGAVPVVVLDEPSVEWFTRAVKHGAVDVLAGKPSAVQLSARSRRWHPRA